MVSYKESVRKINYYRARCAQELSFLTGFDFSIPTFTMLIMTHRCNARCKHCYIWKNRPSEELTSKDWFSTLDELQDWLGHVFISITGGETLLKENMIDILRHAVELGLEVEFLTNGYLMDDTDIHWKSRNINVQVKKMLLRKENAQEAVLFWFHSAGNKVLDYGPRLRINRFFGKITTNRADGAFVRISAPVLNNDVDETIEYEKEFASQLLELFPQCWPIEENAT